MSNEDPLYGGYHYAYLLLLPDHKHVLDLYIELMEYSKDGLSWTLVLPDFMWILIT